MLTDITQEQKDQVIALLDKHGNNYDKVSKRVRLNLQIIYWIDVMENGKHNKTDKGLGPEHLQPYIIATRAIDDRKGWDNTNPKIIKARELYDEGLVEMSTGRDGMTLILYCIPRLDKEERKPLFAAPNEDE